MKGVLGIMSTTNLETITMEPETVTKVKTDQLRLDCLNPRFLGESKHESDEAIIARLYRAAELNELLQSISAGGYLDIEPLVVMSDHRSRGFIVLEGNRRLAALLLLKEPELARKIENSEGIKIRIPPVNNKSHLATFDQVSVYRVESREHARAFLGFKHIKGPKKWSAYAKAQFATEWYKAGQSTGLKLEDIARNIGDLYDTIKRMVLGIYVLEQASEEGLFDIEDRNTNRIPFSHLYSALSRPEYMKYLGLNLIWSRYNLAPNPVPQDKLGELKQVLIWIYGSRSEELLPVVKRQNPDIKRLGEVIAHPQGRHVLEITWNLDAAHSSIEPIDRDLTASLIRARDNIRDAVSSLRAYDGQDQSLLDIAEDIKETAGSVYSSMVKKYREINVAV